MFDKERVVVVVIKQALLLQKAGSNFSLIRLASRRS
jgi:hypothetical protein